MLLFYLGSGRWPIESVWTSWWNGRLLCHWRRPWRSEPAEPPGCRRGRPPRGRRRSWPRCRSPCSATGVELGWRSRLRRAQERSLKHKQEISRYYIQYRYIYIFISYLVLSYFLLDQFFTYLLMKFNADADFLRHILSGIFRIMRLSWAAEQKVHEDVGHQLGLFIADQGLYPHNLRRTEGERKVWCQVAKVRLVTKRLMSVLKKVKNSLKSLSLSWGTAKIEAAATHSQGFDSWGSPSLLPSHIRLDLASRPWSPKEQVLLQAT